MSDHLLIFGIIVSLGHLVPWLVFHFKIIHQCSLQHLEQYWVLDVVQVALVRTVNAEHILHGGPLLDLASERCWLEFVAHAGRRRLTPT